VTNQRIGHHWPMDPRSGRYECESALYSDIVELKVVHEPKFMHSPYMAVHKRGQRYGFMVPVSGSHAVVQQFYDEALCLWQHHRQRDPVNQRVVFLCERFARFSKLNPFNVLPLK
jgi:hypothetical protein